MPIYPYSFQLPPLNVQDIPNNGAVGEFLGISAGGVLDWLPVASGGGDMLKSENLSGLASYPTARTNLGLGTGDSPTFNNLTISTGSISTSAPVTISQTWNGTGSTPFTALKVNATTPGTTSSSGSLLLDLQVGGVTQFSVTKAGGIRFPSTNSILSQTNGTSITIGAPSGNVYLGDTSAFGSSCTIGSSGLYLKNSLSLGWSSDATSFGTPDTILLRDGAPNTLALRNGTNAQTFNVYGTWSSITDYKRLSLSCSNTTGNATFSVPFNSVLAITGGSSTAGVKATVNFAAQAVAFPIGSTVTVTGVTPSGYNGTYTVTESTTTSVSYVNTVNAAWVSGGTATISGSGSMTLASPGHLGIGTTAPIANLHVVGVDGDQDIKRVALFQSNDVNIQANSSVVGITSADVNVNTFQHRLLDLDYTSALSGTVTFGTYMRMLAAGVECAGIGLANNEFVITGGATERLRISAAGNVGIGTTAPAAKLDVAGGTVRIEGGTGQNFGGRVGVLTFYRSDIPTIYNNRITSSVSGTLTQAAITIELANGASSTVTPFRVSADQTVALGGSIVDDGNNGASMIVKGGNVGIGTTAPSSKLHVAETWNNIGTTFCAIKSVITDTNSAAGSDFLELYSGSATQPLRFDIQKTGQLNIYGAWSDTSNYERLSFSAPTAANAIIGTNKAGTGTARGLELQTDGVSRWTISTAGHLLGATDNTYDIGASGANRPRNVYVGSNIVVGASDGVAGSITVGIGASKGIIFGNRGQIGAVADGVFGFVDFAGTSFSRLQLGPNTDAAPAIARDGAGIKFTGAAAGSTSWVKVPPVAVSALPAANTAGAGARAFVNNALSPVFGSAVTGGGSVFVPVYSDGSAWYVG